LAHPIYGTAVWQQRTSNNPWDGMQPTMYVLPLVISYDEDRCRIGLSAASLL